MGNHLLQRVYEGKYSSERLGVELRKEPSHMLQCFNSCYGPVAMQTQVWCLGGKFAAL